MNRQKKIKKLLQIIALIVAIMITLISILQLNIYAFTIGPTPSGNTGYIFNTNDIGEASNGEFDVPNHFPPGMTSFCQNHGDAVGGAIKEMGSTGISGADANSDFSDTATCKAGYTIQKVEFSDGGTSHGHYRWKSEEKDEDNNIISPAGYEWFDNHNLDASTIAKNAEFDKMESGIPTAKNGPTYISYTASDRPMDVPNALAWILSSGASIKDTQLGIWNWLADPKNEAWVNDNEAWGEEAPEGDEMGKVANAYSEFDAFIKRNGGFSQTVEAWNYNKNPNAKERKTKKHLEESTQDGMKKFTYTDTQIAVDKITGEYVLRTILRRLLSKWYSTTRSRVSSTYRMV